MEVKIKLSTSEYQDLVSFCNLNDLLISDVVKKSFISGFNIEKYGLLGGTEKVVEVVKEVIREVEVIKEVPGPPIEIKIVEYVDREVIKEVPIEKIVNVYDNSEIEKLLNRIVELENTEPKTIEIIKEVPIEVIKEVQVEKPVEVIKEVFVDKPENIELKNKFESLQNTLQNLRKENMEKENKIKDYEQKIIEINKSNFDRNAVFLRNSNLNDTLFK